MVKAAFIDRDGVLNELVYHQEQGVIDSPFTVEQFRLLPGIHEAIRMLQIHGYKVVLVSNQPGIAKGNMSWEVFNAIRQKMQGELEDNGVSLDGEYYCLHHPEAKITEWRVQCGRRKPEPGMLLRAAEEMGIDLAQSWMVGDNLSDIRAGKNAGCRTILLGKLKCELCNLMEEKCIRPDVVVRNLGESTQVILKSEIIPERSPNTTGVRFEG